MNTTTRYEALRNLVNGPSTVSALEASAAVSIAKAQRSPFVYEIVGGRRNVVTHDRIIATIALTGGRKVRPLLVSHI